MGYLDLETGVGRKTRAVEESAREFGMAVVRPAGITLDRMPDPADVIAPGSVLWDVHKKFREAGFHRLMIPRAFGGTMGSAPPMAWTLVSEQMGYADAGLAISLAVSTMPFAMAAVSPCAEVRNWAREFAGDTEARMIGCWGITEPDHGSDWVIGTTPAGSDPRLAPGLRAVKKGNEYILNGRKSAWVSNGTIATHSVLHVSLDPSMGAHGQGIAFCPLDLPGISRGKPLNKMGQRPLNQGEIIFEDVRLHKKYMLVPTPGVAGEGSVGRMLLGVANSETGLVMSGLAQAALDEAVAYAKDRFRGGAPIIEDQNVKLTLFNMFAMVQSARSYTRKVSEYGRSGMKSRFVSLAMSSRVTFWAIGKALQIFFRLYDRSRNDPQAGGIAQKIIRSERAKKAMDSGMYGIAAKIFATETAFKVSSEAVRIFGRDGLSKEFLIEKMLRDARASMIEDGANEALAIAGSEDL